MHATFLAAPGTLPPFEACYDRGHKIHYAGISPADALT